MTTRDLRPELLEEAPRCRAGSKTDNPCWRPATEKRFESDPELTACSEHAKFYELVDEADELQRDLWRVQEWLSGLGEEHARLENSLYWMRDQLRGEYAEVSTRARAAGLVARQGPPEEGEPRLTYEESEKLARLILRSDSFNSARTLVEDVSEADLGSFDRALMVAALVEAAVAAQEDVRRYKEGLGISKP